MAKTFKIVGDAKYRATRSEEGPMTTLREMADAYRLTLWRDKGWTQDDAENAALGYQDGFKRAVELAAQHFEKHGTLTGNCLAMEVRALLSDDKAGGGGK